MRRKIYAEAVKTLLHYCILSFGICVGVCVYMCEGVVYGGGG